jgi:hypothetical protein
VGRRSFQGGVSSGKQSAKVFFECFVSQWLTSWAFIFVEVKGVRQMLQQVPSFDSVLSLMPSFPPPPKYFQILVLQNINKGNIKFHTKHLK